MPAARIMIRRDSVTDAACKLDPECQGIDELGAGNEALLRQSK